MYVDSALVKYQMHVIKVNSTNKHKISMNEIYVKSSTLKIRKRWLPDKCESCQQIHCICLKELDEYNDECNIQNTEHLIK